LFDAGKEGQRTSNTSFLQAIDSKRSSRESELIGKERKRAWSDLSVTAETPKRRHEKTGRTATDSSRSCDDSSMSGDDSSRSSSA
jgi:hypothetical protein